MKPKALVIEDNRNMANAFGEALEQAGYEAVVVNNGVSALSMIAISTYHIILLDLHLPLINGDKLLERIRASAHMADTFVILATADAQMAQELDSSADLVLLKPVGFTQLRDMAKRMLPVS
ncbi:MAG: response regulator [Anaerolineae bacterium]|nr:response regulator [Anaerolineae bacterium]